MKVILLAVIVVVVCIVLFLSGIFSPNRSRRMQKRVDHLSQGGERKAQKAGRVGERTGSALRAARRAADKSARKGREIHGRAQGKRHG
jgi:hypothetical protein